MTVSDKYPPHLAISRRKWMSSVSCLTYKMSIHSKAVKEEDEEWKQINSSITWSLHKQKLNSSLIFNRIWPLHSPIHLCMFSYLQLFCRYNINFVSKLKFIHWKSFLVADWLPQEIWLWIRKVRARVVESKLILETENADTCTNLSQLLFGKCSLVILEISSLSKIISNIISISSLNRSFNQFILIRVSSACSFRFLSAKYNSW